MSADNHSKCRICLNMDNELNMNPCFDVNVDQICLASVFTNITGIKIEDCEYFPKKLCQSCTTSIISFKKFLAVFHETNARLKNQICKIEDGFEISDDGNSNFGNFEIYKNDGDCEISESEIRDVKKCYNGNSDKDEKQNVASNIKEEIKSSIEVPQQKNKLLPKQHEPLSEEYKTIPSFKYTCHCGDCFLYKPGFRQHMLSRHDILLDETDFDRYSEEIEVKIPIGFPEFVESKVIVKKKKMQCRICNIRFLTKADVKAHEDIHKTFVCDQCGAAFLYKNYLADHLRVHSEERRYTCHICQKKFKHRYTYAVHKRSHEITRNFVCETCGASFKTEGTMRTHIHIKHSDIRNYSCPSCNLCFNLKSTLDKHFMRKHTPDRKKSFVCSKCGAAYLNNSTLKRHVAEKHLGKAKCFPCTICENKMYVVKKGLQSHMLKKHGIAVDQNI
ncbi:gastrula zinc finger protein XlCGF26.1 [Diabrotica virgifera virgifera]|uniref:Uncharacterized protein n=1 Tax=Diabrotica virgifera virgifera TaxID=50390 RepID=A0ABM5IGA9_DIAVI|nr:gastrula zinc finger protein XlCGF26.1 [Diabrotica virgifera virgifera]